MDKSKSGRPWFVLAGLFAGLFAVNVALRILFIKFHISIWRLGDIGEFLLVLVAMAFFVSGVLSIEEVTESSATPIHDNPQGGHS
jgi:hypothetical protein